MPHYSRQRYYSILNRSLSVSEYIVLLVALLDADPYFFPAHLDMLRYADERRDFILYRTLLNEALSAAQHLFQHQDIQQRCRNEWSVREVEALRELLFLGISRARRPFLHTLLFRLERMLATSVIAPKTVESPKEPHHLRMIKEVDIRQLLAELDATRAYWWQVYTARKHNIAHHQHTWAFLLRTHTNRTANYHAADGVHESVPSVYAKRFPVLLKAILGLADELAVGLGRVAVVMMQPYAEVYRHFDQETHLQGRNRYHLVLKAGKENLLESGDEVVNARPGQLWFFDNKVMHRAENRSPVPRVHVIFDGYPLAS